MPFANPVMGGAELVRNVMQSEGYVPGSAGWQIARDGSAEFNDLDIRGTFHGTDFVINSSGAFFYSGTPALGNLVQSIASGTGTDGEGNAYLNGYANYSGGGTTAVVFAALSVYTFTSPGPAGPWTQGIARVTLSASQLQLQGTPLMLTGPLQNVLTAVQPGTTTSPEGWHPMTLTGGWSGTAEYKLMPDDTVMIRTAASSISGGTTASGTVIWTAPAGYVPAAAQQSIPLIISSVGAGSAPAAGSPYLEITSAGALSVQAISVQAATNLRFCGRYALD